MSKGPADAAAKSLDTSIVNRRHCLRALGATLVGSAGCTAPTAPLTLERTLIATWRGRDPTQAVTLQWLTDDDDTASPTIRVSAPDGSHVTADTAVAPFGPSDYDRVRAEITGLEPDTEYAISVGGSETGYTVQTAPATLDDPLVFAEGGDIGISDDVPALHKQAASWDPLFAIVGGDLAYADGTDSRRWVTFLEDWHEHMRANERLIPIVATIGNHEVRGGMHGTPADAPYYYSLFDNTVRDHAYWTLEVGSYLSIVLLDSNHTTPVPGEQTTWLRETLRSRMDRQHLIAAYHVPAYPSAKPITGAGRARGDVRKLWPPLLEQFNVDVAFEHDDHAYKRTHLLRDGEPHSDGVLYLGDGAWGKGPREVHSPQERPYLAKSVSTLNVIRGEIRPDGIQNYRAVNEAGEIVDTYTRR